MSAIASGRWPLLDRFPRLDRLARVQLRDGPTPVESLAGVAPNLWIKRDDLTAVPLGGNKVRSLEFLLGGVRDGDRVTTVGSRGSTHALATTVYGGSLGADVSLGLWPQEMNPVANRVSAELRVLRAHKREFAAPPLALAWALWRSTRGDRVIPAGGTSPLGILGHVNGALEVAEQVRAGLLPQPKRVVVPLGSGGTAAGVALGFALAGMRPLIVAARVVPRIVGRGGRVIRLAKRARSFLERHAGEPIPIDLAPIEVVNTVYGGAYGRPLESATRAARTLSDAIGVSLDASYSAKAFVAALDVADGTPTLFWLTFDARWLAKGRINDR
jgi:D-cysteine desulfhydrase